MSPILPFIAPTPGLARVWLFDAEAPVVPLPELEETLSADELTRANRFVFASDRRRFVVARGTLRTLLGAMRNVSPRELRFSYGPFGRPALDSDPSLIFSVSHSGDLIAIAVVVGAPGLSLGIDVERIRAFDDMRGVAASVYTEAELAVLDSVTDDAHRLALFFRLWTRKEACMKATGAGFSLPPNSFRVDAAAAPQRVALPAHPAIGSPHLLNVLDLPKLIDGFAGALAIGGELDVDVISHLPERDLSVEATDKATTAEQMSSLRFDRRPSALALPSASLSSTTEKA